MNIEESRDKMLEAIAEHEQMCQAYFQSILQQTGLSEKVIQIWTGKVGILKPVQGKFLPAEEPVEIRFFSEEEQKAESVQESTKIKPLSKQIAGEQILASHFLYGKKKELQSYLKRHYRPYPEKGDKKCAII